MSYVPPSNPQQYPIIWSPGEYGYFPSVLPFDDDDHIDAPQLALGTSPIIPTGSPFTQTNNDPQKRQQLFYVNQDTNSSLVYKNQLVRRGVAVVTLGYGESFTVTYGASAPTIILTQLSATNPVGNIT